MSASPIDAATVARAFADVCAARGLDLVACARAGALNAAVAPQHALPARDDALCAVVGNSRALWEPFLDALVDDEALLSSQDPLDAYVARAVRAAASSAGAAATTIRFAHERPFPPIRAFAEASGLAAAGASMLCTHPTHGPWIALRAVVVFDVDAPGLVAGRAPPCGACDDACGPAYARAAGSSDPLDYLAARAACPLGRASRYPDAQLAYHYAKDRRVLLDEVLRRRAARAARR